MKFANLSTFPAAVLALLGAASTLGAQELTPTSRQQAERYLDQTKQALIQVTSGLTTEQWKFKPAPESWSIAEIVDHLSIVEGLVGGILAKLDQAPAPASDRDWKKTDAMILARVPDRTTKVKAPPEIAPSGHTEPSEVLRRFLEAREQNAAILDSSSSLRQHVVNHPALGPLDGYQWILTIAAHCERHTKQIVEVKANSNFPATTTSALLQNVR